MKSRNPMSMMQLKLSVPAYQLSNCWWNISRWGSTLKSERLWKVSCERKIGSGQIETELQLNIYLQWNIMGWWRKVKKWMKDTFGSCMLVVALIVTVSFAAAFTVPGGNVSDINNAKNGTPVFLGRTSFMVFAVSDALALFSSVTSVLMFLAIYTSRYAEQDFLMSLPQKLGIGLGTLFISMATILVSFSTSLFIILGDIFAWALIPITLFGCVPVVLFALLQLPLFVEYVRSAYWVASSGNIDISTP